MKSFVSSRFLLLTICISIVLLAQLVDGQQDNVFRQDTNNEPPKDYKRHWKVHGVLMGIAWIFCVPCAIAVSWCRSLIPFEGLWFKIHATLMSICVLFTIIAFSIAVHATNAAGMPKFNGAHQRVGLAIFVSLWFHVIGAIFRPKKMAPQTDEEIANRVKPETDPQRKVWVFGHTIVGIVLLILGMYNTNTGPQLYGDMAFLSSDEYLRAWWGWHVVLLSLALCVKIHTYYKDHRDRFWNMPFFNMFEGTKYDNGQDQYDDGQRYNVDEQDIDQHGYNEGYQEDDGWGGGDQAYANEQGFYGDGGDGYANEGDSFAKDDGFGDGYDDQQFSQNDDNGVVYNGGHYQ